MECFEYPIDTQYLLRKKKRIRKELIAENSNRLKKRIVVLGGSTTNEIVDQIDLFLLSYGIEGEFYQSDYGKFWEDAMFGNDILDNYTPDIIYIHTNWRNISWFPCIGSSREEVDEHLKQEFHHFRLMWTKLEEKYHCPIIQNNFERPNYRLLGNCDVYDYRGRANFISKLNQLFYDYADICNNFYINDIDYLSADYGLTKWSEPLFWHMYKYALNFDAIPILAGNVSKIIKAIFGKNKKNLVLDLDNTLWGGVIGDDGVDGIAIGPEVPKGQVYSEFQQYCKNLKSIGVVLSVASKNDEKIALSGLEHPDSVLKESDFVSIKANWEPKNINIKKIASELDLGLDSFVFVDDNPAERLLVSKNISGISVPNVKDVEHYIEVLDHSGYFETISVSEEDIKKTELYKVRANATKFEAGFSDYDEYLKSLNMVAKVDSFESIYVSRIAQLTNKTNQFNLTTKRYSEEDITKFSNDDRYITLYGKLEDRFGDNGLVTVVIGEIIKDELHVRLWLMSCRVLKRGLENVMMNELISRAKEIHINRVIGYYFATDKNAMVKRFYDDMGFSLIKENEDGSSWKLNVDEFIKMPTQIQVIKGD